MLGTIHLFNERNFYPKSLQLSLSEVTQIEEKKTR